MKTNSAKIYPSRMEIMNAISNHVFYHAAELKGGHPIKHGIRIINWAGGFANLYPFIQADGTKIAVKCWCADINNAQERFAKISSFLEKNNCPYLIKTKFVPDALMVSGELYPVGIMEWVEGDTLKDYIEDNTPSKELFLNLANKFLEMVKTLHRLNVSHGDLQHGNIMILPDGSMKLIDYDSMYVPGLDNMQDVIKGLPGYQHPARRNVKFVNTKNDYFSELVIYLSLLLFAEKPSMWQDYVDTEDLLFSCDDFADLQNSDIYKEFKNSSNPQIRSLFQKMLEALSVDDINLLHPLEALLGASQTVKPQSQPIIHIVDAQPIVSGTTSNPYDDVINRIDDLLELLENYNAA